MQRKTATTKPMKINKKNDLPHLSFRSAIKKIRPIIFLINAQGKTGAGGKSTFVRG